MLVVLLRGAALLVPLLDLGEGKRASWRHGANSRGMSLAGLMFKGNSFLALSFHLLFFLYFFSCVVRGSVQRENSCVGWSSVTVGLILLFVLVSSRIC